MFTLPLQISFNGISYPFSTTKYNFCALNNRSFNISVPIVFDTDKTRVKCRDTPHCMQ